MAKQRKDNMNYYQRLSALRKKRIEQRAGKALIITEEEMLEAIDKNKVPTMIQHCILKVSKKIGGNPKEAYLSAVNICGATFADYGYLRKRGSLSMTGKGVKRNRMHQREKEAPAKKARYLSMTQKNWRTALARMHEDQVGSVARELSDVQSALKDLEKQQKTLAQQAKVLAARLQKIKARRKQDKKRKI